MSNLPTGTVTFLFTDIEGSTKLAREHPETWEGARAWHHAILREAIESNHGYVFQIIGDSFCTAFHTAGDALRAAIQAQRTFSTMNASREGGRMNESKENSSFTIHPSSLSLKVRMGIHTGEAESHNGE